MRFWKPTAALFATFMFCVITVAQTGGTTTPGTSATCSAAPANVTGFQAERLVSLSNILTTMTPNAPANTLAALSGGALEIHEIIVYNPQQGTLTDTDMALKAGSPIPTPTSQLTRGQLTSNTLNTFTMAVNQLITSCKPLPSGTFVGTITSSQTGVFGNYTGSPAVVSIGYTTATPPAITNVAVVLPGLVLAYSASATGTLTFPAV